MSIEGCIRTFILENYLFTDDQDALDSSASFMQTGILDSMGVMGVVLFLEEEFGIKVQDEEMVPANLDSVRNLAAFVDRKQAG